MNRKPCPHCGADLPEKAAFCPCCARSLGPRKVLRPPWRPSIRLARTALAVLAVLVLVLAVWQYVRPRVYDNGTAEVLYTDSGGTYQLLLSYWADRFQPMTSYTEEMEEGTEASKSSCLYINYVDNGVNAREAFLRKVDDITVEFLQGGSGPSPWQCTPPGSYSFAPEAALASVMSYTAASGDMELLWTIRMKNGDVIRLHQYLSLDVVPTRHYYPEDAAMDTIEDLQALVDEINETVDAGIIVYLHLPPVTYEGGLALEKRSMNLIGSEGEHRTTFTGTLQVTARRGFICRFDNLDFAGAGSGVGVSASARINFTSCRAAGWRTGVLAYGDAWVNLKDCVFEDNSVGFHFNSTGSNANDHMYSGNLFQRNDTAVLLENVPGSQALSFDGTCFSGNHMDIDNLCRHEVYLAQAIFE